MSIFCAVIFGDSYELVLSRNASPKRLTFHEKKNRSSSFFVNGETVVTLLIANIFFSGCCLGRSRTERPSVSVLSENNGSEGHHITNNAIVHQTKYQKHANTRRIQRLQEGWDRYPGTFQSE